MTIRKTSSRWLPIGFNFGTPSETVEWLNFGNKRLSEPFYNQTLRSLRRDDPTMPIWGTDLSVLAQLASRFPNMEPAGIIFHISRCGSSLLNNALKTGREVVSLSEARPIGSVTASEIPSTYVSAFSDDIDARRTILNNVVKLYAWTKDSISPRLIIKCHAASILQISLFRSLWPSVPFIILIRNPIEVAVSNLELPSAWVKWVQRQHYGKGTFGLPISQLQKMSLEEFCALGIGAFCEAAYQQMDRNCWILDYEDLRPESACMVANLFGIELPTAKASDLKNVFTTYTKDPSGQRIFEDDREKKAVSASESTKKWIEVWAIEPYLKLLQARRI